MSADVTDSCRFYTEILGKIGRHAVPTVEKLCVDRTYRHLRTTGSV
jgi:hypothetical protein